MSDVLGEEEIRRVLSYRITSERFQSVSKIDSVIFNSIDIDTWGTIPIYRVDGYIECREKTRILPKKSKKTFSAKVDAKSGKILTLNWRPG
jgi:hypothetical protein